MPLLRVLPALAPLILAAPVLAQGGPFPDPDATGALRGGRDVRDIVPRTGPQACQRWCEADHVPCDPPNFKIADGRCRPFGGGRF
ncbi:hypothetical protein [Methylobacterium platani]|uniref:Apple domain-containing protein n=2 Tax=Methylobacterium platani TaxID=427683 RepID=A0A179S4V7_9HYPH|nr:hypothetical protein [Methylobacterium platani]KMO19032.1 hypothetical protein SQ03_08765 [Methylobacterium platani JCM 14648]OAS20951.1 hypothetical protein A5481_21670 [Methylobacterium platani]